MFCGNEDCHLHKVDFGPGLERLEKTKYHVVCTGCAAMGPLAETQERAISWWAEPGDICPNCNSSGAKSREQIELELTGAINDLTLAIQNLSINLRNILNGKGK